MYVYFITRRPRSTLFPYTTLFRSLDRRRGCHPCTSDGSISQRRGREHDDHPFTLCGVACKRLTLCLFLLPGSIALFSDSCLGSRVVHRQAKGAGGTGQRGVDLLSLCGVKRVFGVRISYIKRLRRNSEKEGN